MKKNYLIGCSGYYYSNWKNKFYPEGLKPSDWLTYYSTVFNSVELNGTFYKTPKLSDLKRYANVTEDDFKFSVKMSKYITHILKLNDCKQIITDFQDLIKEGLKDKLTNFLFQLPPSYHYTKENLDKILTNISHHPHNVVEFRHISWWNEEVKQEFKNSGLTFCNVDLPGLASYFISSSPVFYLRLHGNPELFKSSYSSEKLKEFHEKIPLNSLQTMVYFNNTYYEAGYKNAREFMNIAKVSRF